MKRKYVYVVYNAETQRNLREWCEQNGFDLTKNYWGEDQKANNFSFHTTIIYSSNESEIAEAIRSESRIVTVTGFDYIGENRDIPALLVDSTSLRKMRAHYEELGLRDDEFPEFLPHISVSYDRETAGDRTVKMPTFPLVFDTLIVEDIDDEPTTKVESVQEEVAEEVVEETEKKPSKKRKSSKKDDDTVGLDITEIE